MKIGTWKFNNFSNPELFAPREEIFRHRLESFQTPDVAWENFKFNELVVRL